MIKCPNCGAPMYASREHCDGHDHPSVVCICGATYIDTTIILERD